MSYPILVTVQVKDGPDFTDYSNLTVSQFMFAHHTFSLDLSFEALGRALGIGAEQLHVRAHQQLVGKDINISWQTALPLAQAGIFRFRGVITEASIRSSTDLANYYHLSGYSPTVLLEDGLQNRTFRQKSLQAIFQQVLTAYPSEAPAYELKARGQQALPYVVQYQESNYQFLSRVAAQQGEWLFYDGLRLRLGPLPQDEATHFQTNGVQAFDLSLRLQPLSTEGGAYNYRTHEPLKTNATAPTGGHAYNQLAVSTSQRVFTQPQRVQATTRLAGQAQLQQALDTLAAKRAGTLVTLEGNGEVIDLAPGRLLDVYDAPGASYGQFRALVVHHFVDGDGNYRNHFEALPGSLDTPPAQPPAAPLAQPELAEVINVQDPRQLGRVRVRFQWAVQQAADAESGWLRVSTPYSGDGKGQLFTPEPGSQVLVGYEQGLAEFPVVLGNLFHPQNKQGASYSTPQNHLKGLQTAGGNKFVMSDTAQAQTILISNSNKKSTAIAISFQGDGSVHIQTEGPVTVNGSSITLEAGNDGQISLHAKTIAIAAEEDITVASKSKSIALTAGKDILVEAAEKMQVQATEKTITTSQQLHIDGGANL